jgi:hypothetical protein
VLLGASAPFNAGEEFDLMIRALASGSKIVDAAEVQVEHLGAREGDDVATGSRSAATLAKHIRLRTPGSIGWAVDWVVHFGFAGLRNALSGKLPTGLGLVAGMLKRMCLSSKRQIDHDRQVGVRSLSSAAMARRATGR